MPDEEEKGKESPYVQIRPPRRGDVFPRRVRGIKESYEVDTRKTVEKAIRNLEELAEEAHKRATSKYLPTEDRQRWARIEAYIYQTINGLAKTRDTQAIMEKLEELTRRVDKLMEEDREPRKEG
jgi:low affinity Fe/Cu permease